MVNITPSIIAFLLAASASLTFAAPVEVTPSSPLYERDTDICRDGTGGWGRGLVSEAVECINYLASLNQACDASYSPRKYCQRGNTVIQAISVGNAQFSSSTCKDVARGLGKIMDSCSRSDGTVMGQTAAWGNGNLVVAICSNCV